MVPNTSVVPSPALCSPVISDVSTVLAGGPRRLVLRFNERLSGEGNEWKELAIREAFFATYDTDMGQDYFVHLIGPQTISMYLVVDCYCNKFPTVDGIKWSSPAIPMARVNNAIQGLSISQADVGATKTLRKTGNIGIITANGEEVEKLRRNQRWTKELAATA